MRLQSYVDRFSHQGITGWAIDWDQPAVPVELLIVINGKNVTRIKADQLRPKLRDSLGNGATGYQEFSYLFPQPLAPNDTYFIEVWTAEPQELLTRGRCILHATRAGAGRYTPVILTSTGRSGTTMLMEEFSMHPEIVIAASYPFEIKQTSYYAAAWNALSAGGYKATGAEIDFGAVATRDQLIGPNPWNRPDLLAAVGSRRTARLFQTTYPERLLSLFRNTIEEYYTIIADETLEGITPRFFAEKGILQKPVRDAIRLMFGTIREVVIVRDPRDYLCSAQRFWKFDVQSAIDNMRSDFPALLNILREDQRDTFFVRYEDLILDPEASRERMYEFFGSLPPPKDAGPRVHLVPDSHRTSKSPAESIGRFKTELNADALSACQNAFGPFMKAFGYE